MRIGAVEMVVKKRADLRESGELPFIYLEQPHFSLQKGKQTIQVINTDLKKGKKLIRKILKVAS